MPLAIDLFCGLGGWTEGLLAEGYDCIGFDIERHQYGAHRYPAQLVIQDVLTLHGSQFKDATLIVASPPCQEYSYMAMPWSRAKTIAAEYRSGKRDVKQLTALFDACFRIQREACEAAGRHVPMVVENVRGAIPWVGRSRWSYGSFHLWGDVPALMPPIAARMTMKAAFSHQPGGATIWEAYREREARKVAGIDFNGYGTPGYKPKGFNVTAAQRYRAEVDGVKCGGDWFNAAQPSISRPTSIKSDSRKAASAMIAKIPEPLARHIAAVYRAGA